MSVTDDFRPSVEPSHKAYANAPEGGDARRVEIGLAHTHRDGKGCEIRLYDGGVIVVRPMGEALPS